MNSKKDLSTIPSIFNEGTFPSFLRHFTLFDDDTWTPSLPADRSNISVSEDDKHVYVEANLPGVPEESIDISMDKGVLWIKGEAQEKEEDKNKKYYYKANRSFSYRLAVPGNVDETKEPAASFVDGVIKIDFQKQAKETPRKIQIKKGS